MQTVAQSWPVLQLTDSPFLSYGVFPIDRFAARAAELERAWCAQGRPGG